jgi:hypothetical protein
MQLVNDGMSRSRNFTADKADALAFMVNQKCAEKRLDRLNEPIWLLTELFESNADFFMNVRPNSDTAEHRAELSHHFLKIAAEEEISGQANVLSACPLVRVAFVHYREGERLGHLLVFPRDEGDRRAATELEAVLRVDVTVLEPSQ